jgi:hypothetical protein
MAEVKTARPQTTESEAVIERAKDFWERFGKTIAIALGAVVLVVGGFLIYKNFVSGPKKRRQPMPSSGHRNIMDRTLWIKP